MNTNDNDKSFKESNNWRKGLKIKVVVENTFRKYVSLSDGIFIEKTVLDDESDKILEQSNNWNYIFGEQQIES